MEERRRERGGERKDKDRANHSTVHDSVLDPTQRRDVCVDLPGARDPEEEEGGGVVGFRLSFRFGLRFRCTCFTFGVGLTSDTFTLAFGFALALDLVSRAPSVVLLLLVAQRRPFLHLPSLTLPRCLHFRY
ncbi:hypothetical protein FA13DRAFT_1741440 [Coprinellus micaceus]|uniref:Uncharacterized protein n=1 Tax=Coprinellus micaceus TaxID=71717 RepID=A0A4Y7SKV7_COPMI|nr:hypothetical protein FA13DRAFT_1741440 [Coprinellus micaceus]